MRPSRVALASSASSLDTKQFVAIDRQEHTIRLFDPPIELFLPQLLPRLCDEAVLTLDEILGAEARVNRPIRCTRNPNLHDISTRVDHKATRVLDGRVPIWS